MFVRMTVLAAILALAACANVTPAGRNARAGGMDAPPEPPPRAAPVVRQPTRAPDLPPPSAPAPASTYAPSSPALVTPPAAMPARPAPSAAPVVAPVVTPSPPVAAPSVAAPAADRPPPRRGNDDDVVVQGAARQITPPGDPRTASERMQDINSWDRCVSHVQAAFESDPMRPQLQTPEEYCSQSLGMANRDAIPISRQSRRPGR